jgi:hypothetical protein
MVVLKRRNHDRAPGFAVVLSQLVEILFQQWVEVVGIAEFVGSPGKLFAIFAE